MDSTLPEELGGGGNRRSKVARGGGETVLQSLRVRLLELNIGAHGQNRLVETISGVLGLSLEVARGDRTRRSTVVRTERVRSTRGALSVRCPNRCTPVTFSGKTENSGHLLVHTANPKSASA
ncbi:hypothetical protein RHMOL_Rhmol02G0193900 [Rhododendron molle]|uniref:Uncharacterized protein n=1 Tax=Rhododendron molle TaxID=49168 RepID=A0ACC0PUN7_RHOML|nr:hypothetical protein RHMOL_Rhmol02G0193900 [Rhododendron molle]